MIEILIMIAALAVIVVSIYAGVKAALMAFEQISTPLWGMLAAVIVFSIVASVVSLVLNMILGVVGLAMIV